MSEKNLLEGRTGPVTQSVDAIKNLLAFVGRASNPLPLDVTLDNGRLVLILSNKKDAYYTCTAAKCSCPGNQFRHNCKHMRRYFPEAATTKTASSDPIIKRGGFKPFDEMPGERAAKASSLSAIDCVDTTPQDVAYHSIREDREMWPAEA